DIAFGTQVSHPGAGVKGDWSLSDIALDLLTLLKLTGSFWNFWNYFGEASVRADLRVGEMSLFKTEKYPFGFPTILYKDDREAALSLDSSIMQSTYTPESSGNAELDISFASLTINLTRTVASILNQLLRSLNHAADVEKLEDGVKALVNALT